MTGPDPFAVESVCPRQLNLDDRPVWQKRAFLLALSQLGGGTQVTFDQLDATVSAARQPDPEMSIERYVRLTQDNSIFRLKTEDAAFGLPHRLRVSCSWVKDPVQPQSDRFAWFECDLTEANYRAVGRAFETAFNQPFREALDSAFHG